MNIDETILKNMNIENLVTSAIHAPAPVHLPQQLLLNLSKTKKNILITVTFISIFIFTQLCLRNVTKVARDEQLDISLPDIYHESLPNMREWHEYSDWMPVAPLMLFTILDKFEHFYEFWLLISLIYLMRAVCFSMTVTPSPSSSCKCEWEFEPVTPLRKLLNVIYQEGCNDNIFSGHTSMMVMSSLFIVTYIVPGSMLCKIILLIYNIIGFLVIISCRLHYSVDCFIASVISVLLFYAYKPI